ncbi:MAG: creatininase family protein [Rhodospirillaceae bacterium]|jgi:creatinine amidohydrolase|nr:creatininase family protein [Rhodospirillaceae bacterium]
MRIADMNWMQVEDYLAGDDRCIVPIGSTEQHGPLSLCVDAILSERVAIEAAEPLGVPVYPAMPFGCAPYFSAFPGSISLRVETLLAVARDLVASLHTSGFRRVMIVNGHGGNSAVGNLTQELMAEYTDMSIKFHAWYAAPRTMAKAKEVHANPSHANWFENFPWTRLANIAMPSEEKPMVDFTALKLSSPAGARELLGDGCFGGAYQIEDEKMLALWATGVEETREMLEGPWPN